MEFGLLALLNRILENIARLWQTLQHLSRVVEGGRLHPHRFDANLMRSLNPATVKTNQRQVGRFLNWLDERETLGMVRYPNAAHEWDDAVCSYPCPTVDEDRRPPCTKSQAENLVAGLPRLKKELSYTRVLVVDWEK